MIQNGLAKGNMTSEERLATMVAGKRLMKHKVETLLQSCLLWPAILLPDSVLLNL